MQILLRVVFSSFLGLQIEVSPPHQFIYILMSIVSDGGVLFLQPDIVISVSDLLIFSLVCIKNDKLCGLYEKMTGCG